MKLKLLLTALLVCTINLVSFSYTPELNKLIQKANEGDAFSQNNLGDFYYSGRGGVIRNYSKAFDWYSKAANQGNAFAQTNLGYCYYWGNGVAQNYSKAFEWYLKAANQGNAFAQYNVGSCFQYGNGVKKDLSKALGWYYKSFNQGFQLAKKNVEELKSQGVIASMSSQIERHDKSNPPILDFVVNSVQFIEPSGNNAIDANELSHIRFKVKNSGLGAAYGCTVNIKATGSTGGLTYSSQTLPSLAVGDTQTVEIPIQSSMNTIKGIANFTVQIDEPNGFGTDPVILAVNTNVFEAPLLKIVDYTVTSDQVGVLMKRRAFDLQLLLQNTRYGKAENVIVEVKVPNNVFIIGDNQKQQFPSLSGGVKKSIVYTLIVNNNYLSDIIPIEVKILEKYGKYAENKVINLKLNQTLASNKIVVDEKSTTRNEIQLGSLSSDVDKNIPIKKTISNKVFAVIIANEHYSKVASVPFALNDGRVFAEYCEKTLGLPERNIHFVKNATLNDLKYQVEWLRQIINAYNGKAKVIFYYAGHGIPDESNKTAYLLPVDGYATDANSGYKLDDLYAALGQFPTQSVTVLLDACFSGAKREGDMLASARGIAIRVKSGIPQGNMVVFSAAQGDETAYPNIEQQHGLFTYYLLKKLQETQGNVFYEQLNDYITQQVRQQSLVLNGKSQTPTVIPSSKIGETWKLWTFN